MSIGGIRSDLMGVGGRCGERGREVRVLEGVGVGGVGEAGGRR